MSFRHPPRLRFSPGRTVLALGALALLGWAQGPAAAPAAAVSSMTSAHPVAAAATTSTPPASAAPAAPAAHAATTKPATATAGTGKSQPAADPEYVIGPGDVLAIDVYGDAELSRTLPVRPDGRLILPLVGEVMAQGLTADGLQDLITERLKKYIESPNVAVMLQDPQSQRYNVLGMVVKPGSYVLNHPMTILDALAEAGGLAPYAHGKDIYVIRKGPDGKEKRIAFNYIAVSRGQHLEQNIALQPEDTIVIP